ncbi:MAG: MFS transporter [Robiginitomaculum sp.]
MGSNNVATSNALVLSMAQAFNGSIGAIAISLGALAGAWLMPGKLALATLPVAGYSIGAALFALPVAALGRKFGRRNSFIIGACIGIIGAAFSAYAINMRGFWLFCAGYLLIGGASAFVQQYRFAAADSGDDKFKSRAISWVLTGGVLAAFIGTEVVLRTKDLLDPLPFAGGFVGMAGLLIVGIGVLTLLKPVGARGVEVESQGAGEARPSGEIIRQPVFIVALLCATASYALMTFMMTGAPLAMKHHGHSEAQAVLGIRWHVLAMYAPSFFTGALIVRFGKLPIIGAGLALLLICAGVALAGLELWNFWTSLILLGIGWNFGFIGSTALLGEAYSAAEKSRIQGLHDFILFSCVAAASLASGVTLSAYGWSGVAIVLIPVSIMAGLSLIWLRTRR